PNHKRAIVIIVACASPSPPLPDIAMVKNLLLGFSRHPLNKFLHKILDYEDEFFAALMLILEGHSLRTTDALFAESLYGLRRKSVRLRLSKGSSKEVQRSTLEKRQRVLSVVFLVVLPYFKSKSHGISNKEREARLWESLWGSKNQGFDEANFFTGEETVVLRGDSGNH
ncbi:unnamed protein product, partial [Brassica rapa]